MSKSADSALIAPCGMNCEICVSYYGYAVNGRKRKITCIGCRPRDKSCAFVKKGCDLLTKKKIDFCYECDNFPCIKLKGLDDRYQRKYDMSMIENLEYIQKNGIDKFITKERKRWDCPECGGIICVHTKKCYKCEENR